MNILDSRLYFGYAQGRGRKKFYGRERQEIAARLELASRRIWKSPIYLSSIHTASNTATVGLGTSTWSARLSWWILGIGRAHEHCVYKQNMWP